MKTTLLSILVLTLVSCDATSKEWIGTSWIVSELNQDGKKSAVTNDVILTIKSETEFTLKLDTNNCFGTYTITGKSNIKLENLGCTEMCCDSDFSKAISNALYKVSTINFTKETASLSGNKVKIKFKKYDVSLLSKETMTKGEKIPTKETTDVGMFEQTDTNSQTVETIPEGDFITLYKSPCKGTCEEFTMEFYENGAVIYNGKFNAKVQGRKVVAFDKSEFDTLFSAFEQSNCTNFADTYDDENIMDIQNTFLTYKGKKIQIRYQPNAPDELKALLLKVEEKAKVVLEELKKK